MMKTALLSATLLLVAVSTYRADAQTADIGTMSDADVIKCQSEFAATAALPPDIDVQGSTERFQDRNLPLGASEVAPQATTSVSLVAGEKDGRGLLSYSHGYLTSAGKVGDLSVKVSAPFNQATRQAIFASLNGLSGDLVVSGSFSHFSWDLTPANYGAALCSECQAQGLTLLECNLTDLKPALKKKGLSDEAVAAVIQRIEDRLFGRTTGKILGAEGSVGHQERSFFEPSGIKSKEDRLGYSLAATGGAIFKSWSLYGRLTGKRDFKKRDDATLCSPVTGSVLESCTVLPLGKAAAVESLVAALEARRFFSNFAVAPSAQYDFKSEVWGVEAPLFLVRNEQGAFTGGVKFGWRSDQHDLITAIFITKGLAP